VRNGRVLLFRVFYGYWLPDLRSNSPLRTPPTKASHSAGVKFKTAPLGCLLSRTRILSFVRPATSTQLPLYALRELFIHVPAESPPESRPFQAKSRMSPPSLFFCVDLSKDSSQLASGNAAAIS
jgi:hypothetical protein